MSLFEVLHEYGLFLFLRFVVVALVFLVLHAVRVPLVGLVLVVEGALRGLDRCACAQGVAR